MCVCVCACVCVCVCVCVCACVYACLSERVHKNLLSYSFLYGWIFNGVFHKHSEFRCINLWTSVPGYEKKKCAQMSYCVCEYTIVMNQCRYCIIVCVCVCVLVSRSQTNTLVFPWNNSTIGMVPDSLPASVRVWLRKTMYVCRPHVMPLSSSSTGHHPLISHCPLLVSFPTWTHLPVRGPLPASFTLFAVQLGWVVSRGLQEVFTTPVACRK